MTNHIVDYDFPPEGAASPSDPIVRQAVYKAFNGRCFYTSHPVPRENFVVEHIVPRSQGGPDNLYNFALTSPRINTLKGGLLDRDRVIGVLYIVGLRFVPNMLKHMRALRQQATARESEVVLQSGRFAGLPFREAKKRFKGYRTRRMNRLRPYLGRDLAKNPGCISAIELFISCDRPLQVIIKLTTGGFDCFPDKEELLSKIRACYLHLRQFKPNMPRIALRNAVFYALLRFLKPQGDVVDRTFEASLTARCRETGDLVEI